MAATRADLRAWYLDGVRQGYRYMIVVCDTYDGEDYPEYTRDYGAALRFVRDPGDMQRIHEAYDLTGDMEAQLAERMAWCL